jgi:hypothetical protein
VTRLDLPDDNWAVLYQPNKVRERTRRRYVSAVADLNARVSQLPQIPNPDTETPDRPATVPDPGSFSSTETDLTDRMVDMLILCLVKEWSYGPVDDTVLGDLDAGSYDRIAKVCRDLAPQLTPDYSPDVDPKAPTSGSGGPRPDSSTEETFEIPSYAPTS